MVVCNSKPVEFIPTDPTLDVYEGAEKMLLKNFSVKLSNDDPAMGEFYFRDMVLNIWSVLKNLMDKDIEKESTSDLYYNIINLKLYFKLYI
jgi:hypothetical protein